VISDERLETNNEVVRGWRLEVGGWDRELLKGESGKKEIESEGRE